MTFMELRILQTLRRSMKRLDDIDLSPSCKSLCGHGLRRLHLTCLYCRIRRMRYGKMPGSIQVRVYYVAVQIAPPRRFARVKDIIFRRLMNVAEILAT